MEEKNKISGPIFVYITLLLFLVIIESIGLISTLGMVTSGFSTVRYTGVIILFILTVTAFISILKRSPKAVVINRIFLTIYTAVNLYNFIKFKATMDVTPTEAPDAVIALFTGLSFIPFLISALFLLYWIFSKNVKMKFEKPKVVETVSVSTPIISTSSEIPATTPSPINPMADALHRGVFSIIVLISCCMFIYTGLLFFFAIPAALLFSAIYISQMNKVFIKYNATPAYIYSILITTLLSYTSTLLNIGVLTDSDKPFFLLPGLLFNAAGSEFVPLFTSLLLLTFFYFLFATTFNIRTIKSKNQKYLLVLIPLLGLMLLSFHVIPVLKAGPKLKADVEEAEKKYQQENKQYKESIYSFNFDRDEIVDKVINKNQSAYFDLSNITSTQDPNGCAYQISVAEMLLAKSDKPINSACLNSFLKPIGEMPMTKKDYISINLPFDNPSLKKGDVLVLVAHIPKDGYISISDMKNPDFYVATTENRDVVALYSVQNDKTTDLKISIVAYGSSVVLKEIGLITIRSK